MSIDGDVEAGARAMFCFVFVCLLFAFKGVNGYNEICGQCGEEMFTFTPVFRLTRS